MLFRSRDRIRRLRAHGRHLTTGVTCQRLWRHCYHGSSRRMSSSTSADAGEQGHQPPEFGARVELVHQPPTHPAAAPRVLPAALVVVPGTLPSRRHSCAPRPRPASPRPWPRPGPVSPAPPRSWPATANREGTQPARPSREGTLHFSDLSTRSRCPAC